MIVVTGGAGFIGSVLVKELNSRGITDILIVDRLRDTSKWLNLRGLKFLEYVHSDSFIDLIEDPEYCENISCVYHLGACSSTTEMDMDYLIHNNLNYSKLLFDTCAINDIPFLYASSAATYGLGELGYSDDNKVIPHLTPLNPYGYSKQLFDEWVLKQIDTPTKWFGIKFFNVYGPNEYHKGPMRSMVEQAFYQVKSTKAVKLFKSHRSDFKDGEQLRDFVYVKDVARAMIELMDSKKKNISGIYNMGTSKARTFNDLASAVFLAMNLPIRIDYVDMPDNLKNQYQYYTQADMRKFFLVLPKFNFLSVEDGVKDYVCNHLMQDSIYY